MSPNKVDPLSAVRVTVGSPTIGAPTLAHGLAAEDLAVGPPRVTFPRRRIHRLEVGGDEIDLPERRQRRKKQDRIKPYGPKCFPNGFIGFTPTEVSDVILTAMEKDGVKPAAHPSTVLRTFGLKK
jgi:hypothetical protein